MKSNKTNKKSGDEVEVGDLFRSIGKGLSPVPEPKLNGLKSVT